MTLRQLSLTNFRNLSKSTIEFHRGFNIIHGSNASGKTSLLESIYFVSEGRSFKTHQSTQCICKDQQEFLLFARFDRYKVGISRTRHNIKIHVDENSVQRVSDLTRLSPVRIIDSRLYETFTGSPKSRRQFIDWYLFHVEPEYHRIWSEHKHALKQRNALLKQKGDLKHLDSWDELLSKYGNEISKYRKNHINELIKTLHQQFGHLISDLDIQLDFMVGWNPDHSLLVDLQKSRIKDLRYGFTNIGSHRDDLVIKSGGVNFHQVLSRGQIKRVGISLILSQLYLLTKFSNKHALVLIDDLHAELDDQSVNCCLTALHSLGLQTFISDISSYSYPEFVKQDCRLFHVEHGMIESTENTLRAS